MSDESVLTYKVLYKGKPGHEVIKKGIHATSCITLEDAQEKVETCKKWFNTVVVEPPVYSSDGKVLKTPAKVETQDRVFVWINDYKDGNLAVDREEETCSLPGSPEKTASGATSSEQEKSPKKSTSTNSERPSKVA